MGTRVVRGWVAEVAGRAWEGGGVEVDAGGALAGGGGF